jgi:hypothetical protein
VMRGEQNDAKRQQELRRLCGEVREEIENGLSCLEQRSAASFADLSKMINEFAHLQNASPTGEPEFLRYLGRQDGTFDISDFYTIRIDGLFCSVGTL